MSGREVGAAWGPPLDVSALSWGPEPLSIGVDPHPRHPMVGLTGAGAGEGEGPQPHGGRGCTRGASGRLEWETSTAGLRPLLLFLVTLPKAAGVSCPLFRPLLLHANLERLHSDSVLLATGHNVWQLPKKVQMTSKYIKFH